MAKVPFLKRVQNSPKLRANKKKRKALDAAGKRLGVEYRRLIKSESKRLAKKIKPVKKSKKKKRR